MTKREISCILARASGAEVQKIGKELQKNHRVELLKQPQKTLVMVQVRESVQKTLFYLGEVLATECLVQVDGSKGFCVMAGDDFDKVLYSAVIDGVLNGGCVETDWIYREVRTLGQKQEQERAAWNGRILKSKVHFNVMGE